jgi:hypothetical protein
MLMGVGPRLLACKKRQNDRCRVNSSVADFDPATGWKNSP